MKLSGVNIELGRAIHGLSRRLWQESHWTRLLTLVRPHRWLVTLVAAVSFVGGLLEAAFLVIVTQTALAIADGQDGVKLPVGGNVTLAGALVTALAILTISLTSSIAGIRAQTSLAARVLIGLRRRLADAFLATSWATQQAEPSGQFPQLVTRFADNASDSVRALVIVLVNALNLGAILVIALFVNALATLFIFGALLLLAMALAPVRKRIKFRSKAKAIAGMELATSMDELGSLGLEMQVFGVRSAFATRARHLISQEALTRRRSDAMNMAITPIYIALAYGALVCALSIATTVGIGGLAAVGAVTLLMLRSLTYGQTVQAALGSLMQSLPFLEKFDETIERYQSTPSSGGARQPEHVAPVRAQALTFAYELERQVLQDVSFTIQPGEVVGVIGPSGAGKSTLVQLLLGVRDPTEGVITISGVDLREIDRAWWTSRVAFVAQDAMLFTGTLAENIRFFREGLDDQAIREAARKANFLDDIERLPNGFNTHLGERGSQLSGGQRQRLSIARALAGRPEMLILDEPTSALDVHSEALIRRTFTELRGKVTVVIIAHRMSTLEMCDSIMVIENGRLTAHETPERLRADSNFYRQALNLSGMR